MAIGADQLRAEGDFFVQVNPGLTRQLLAANARYPQMNDFAEICRQWLVRPPAPMKESLTMFADLGKSYPLFLTDLVVSGAW